MIVNYRHVLMLFRSPHSTRLVLSQVAPYGQQGMGGYNQPQQTGQQGPPTYFSPPQQTPQGPAQSAYLQPRPPPQQVQVSAERRADRIVSALLLSRVRQ